MAAEAEHEIVLSSSSNAHGEIGDANGSFETVEDLEEGLVAVGFEVDFSSMKDQLNKIAYMKFKKCSGTQRDYTVLTGIYFAINRDKYGMIKWFNVQPVSFKGQVVNLYVSRNDDIIVAEIEYGQKESFLSVFLNEKSFTSGKIRHDIKTGDKSYRKIKVNRQSVICLPYLHREIGGHINIRYKEQQ